MAKYKTHSLFNLFFALPILLAAAYYFLPLSQKVLLIFALSFAYATLFMNPDLDLAHKIKLCSLRGLLSLPFRGYSRLFRHRGVSHIPVLGTLIRVAWLGGCVALVMLIAQGTLPTQWSILTLVKNQAFLTILVGVASADGCHLLLDVGH